MADAAGNPVHLEAARQAAADGQRKAQAFADGVGARLGRVISLVEPGTETVGPLARRADFVAAAAPGSEPMSIEPGEYEVSAAVDVTFALELT